MGGCFLTHTVHTLHSRTWPNLGVKLAGYGVVKHLVNLENSGNSALFREKSRKLGKVGDIVVRLQCATTVAIVTK